MKLYNKHGLVVFGSGGRFVNSVQELFRSYQSSESVTLPESRKIAIDCYLETINTINKNAEIRPFLEKYPLTSTEIELDIVFTNPMTNEHFASPSMAFISIYNNKIKYYASPQSHLPYKLVKTEALEIALELAKKPYEK